MNTELAQQSIFGSPWTKWMISTLRKMPVIRFLLATRGKMTFSKRKMQRTIWTLHFVTWASEESRQPKTQLGKLPVLEERRKMMRMKTKMMTPGATPTVSHATDPNSAVIWRGLLRHTMQLGTQIALHTSYSVRNSRRMPRASANNECSASISQTGMGG
jgi:hypothetical protein